MHNIAHISADVNLPTYHFLKNLLTFAHMDTKIAIHRIDTIKEIKVILPYLNNKDAP